MRRNSLHRSVGRSKNVEKNSLWPAASRRNNMLSPMSWNTRVRRIAIGHTASHTASRSTAASEPA